MVFCNQYRGIWYWQSRRVTILILIDGFLQYYPYIKTNWYKGQVTILILIDGFLQFIREIVCLKMTCHNPYFNRWFSAITDRWRHQFSKEWVTILILIDGFLQYHLTHLILQMKECHNPYFNRWFSAIFHRFQRIYR